MIVNTYAVLDASVSLLRLGLGLLVLGLALAAWRHGRRGAAAERRDELERRGDLLALPAGLLLVLNVASWPLLYLLLQSYVAEWPGVMCVYGVTRVGAGSLGPARFLPPLLAALQALKPALVFAGGAWLTLHALNRRTRAAPLTGRALAALALAGLLACADAAAELAYLAIPKREEFLSGGCCAEAFDAGAYAARFVPAAWLDEAARPWLYAAYGGANLLLVGVLYAAGRRYPRRPAPGWLALAPGAALLAAAVNLDFLIQAGAPRLLGLPYHHCPYDLIPQAPEAVAALALFVLGAFCAGWAVVAGGPGGAAGASAPVYAGRLLRLGAALCLTSLVMLSVELALA